MLDEKKPTTVINGLVEVFERREIKGWVEVAKDAGPVRVSMCINGEEIVSTWAATVGGRRTQGENRHFRFSVTDFWKYARKTDQVSVQANGKTLPIATRGTYYKPWVGGEESLESLQKMREQGYVFGQDGRLRLSKTKDDQWQRQVMGLYDRVREVMEQKFSLHPFFCYGTLLGAVREGGFIGHDLDFDAAYISSHATYEEITNELQQLAFALIDEGFEVQAKWCCLVIRDKLSEGTKIDLFHLYYDTDDQLAFPFGIAGTSTISRGDLGSMREIDLGGSHGLVPENAEALVEHIYGASWRTPNPGFAWRHDRSTRGKVILQSHHIEEVYWANFYATATYTSGSSFCDFILQRPELPKAIVDIGCGDGRDSFAFAQAGRAVVGLDRSHIGVRHASAKIAEMLPDANASFAACDVGDEQRLAQVIEEFRNKNNDTNIVFYARFFLHSIPEEVQHALLENLRKHARGGDYLCVEFRTDKDEAKNKVHGKHYRRYQNAQRFVDSLTNDYEFTPLVRQEGNGFSPYKGEDPELLRVIASSSKA